MADRIVSLQQASTENSIFARKNVQTATFGKRPALGEIGNKVDRFAQPLRGDAPLKKTLPVKAVTDKLVSKLTNQPTKPEKPAARRPLKSVASTSSLFPVSSVNETTKVTESYSTSVLQDVEDIDAADLGNPLLVPAYAAEIHQYLLELEQKFPIKECFLSSQREVTPRMRAVLVDWLIDVQEEYKLLQETMFLTVQIADRYLQEVSTAKQHLQLVGVSALFLACKYEEIYSLDVEELVFITDKAYTKSEILSMEKKILQVLKFDLGKPLSLHFLRRFSKAAKVTSLHHNFSKYFLEWALVDYGLCHIRPSHLAAGALFISMNLCDSGKPTSSRKVWNSSVEHHCGVKLADVQSVAVKMAAVAIKAQHSKYTAIGKKYSSGKMMKVSLRPELGSDTLVNISQGVLP